MLLAVFTISVGVYGVEHGVHGLAPRDFAPDATIFIAVAPVLLYSFVGIELPADGGRGDGRIRGATFPSRSCGPESLRR